MTHPLVPTQPRVGGIAYVMNHGTGGLFFLFPEEGEGRLPLCCDRSLTIKLNHSAFNRFLPIKQWKVSYLEHALIDITELKEPVC